MFEALKIWLGWPKPESEADPVAAVYARRSARLRMSAGHGSSEGESTPARRPSQNPSLDSHNQPEQPSLSIESLLAISEQFREQPDEVQQWLESLRPHAPNSKVPFEVVTLDGTATYLGKASTFSDVLADWLSLWSSRLEKARKERTASSQANKFSNKHLDWLLAFMNDYLNTYDGQISRSSAEGIAQEVLTFCLNAKSSEHVSAALPILAYISRKDAYPTRLIGDTMKALAGSIVHIPDAGPSIYSCLQPIADRGLGVDNLFALVATPTQENGGKHLLYARGALRLLCQLLETQDPVEDRPVNLLKFIDALRLAATQQIVRYAVDILNACNRLLLSPAQGRLDLSQFEKIVDTARLCLAAGSDSSTELTTTTSPTSSSRTDQDRNLERHLQDRQSSATLLGDNLNRLIEERPEFFTVAVIDYTLEHPFSNPTELIVQCIETSKTRHLFKPPIPKWRARIELLVESYLSNKLVDPVCRAHAIRALRDLVETHPSTRRNSSLTQATEVSPDQYPWSFVIESVLKQIPSEELVEVLTEFSQLLIQVLNHSEDDKFGDDHAIQVIGKLESLLMKDLPPTSTARQSAVHATKALVQVFATTLLSRPRRAVAAFQSLTSIASTQCRFTESRIEAMKVLFRLRSTSNGYVFLTNDTESGYISAALCRTRKSVQSFNFELPSTQRQSTSSTQPTVKSYQNLWMFDDEFDVSFEADKPSRYVTVNPDAAINLDSLKLDIGSWLLQVIYSLQGDPEWETLCLCLVNAGSQLSNISLFKGSLSTIVELRKILCDQIVRGIVREGPPATGLKKSDVGLCLYNILTPLIAYATIKHETIHKEFGDDLVRAFLHGLGGTAFEGTDRDCIHALSICALELPRSVGSQYPNMLARIGSSITKSYLTLHVLEFLSQVAALPEVHSHFREDEVKSIFAMCVQYLEKTREQNNFAKRDLPARTATLSARQSGVSSKRPPYRAAIMKDTGEPRYASALAYHTMICWFLSLPLERRKVYVSWLVPRLTWNKNANEEMIDEQSEVFIDMMQRTAFSDLGETAPDPAFAQPSDGPVESASWVVGYSIITAESAGRTGRTQITKRQASGTTYSIYQQSTVPIPPHHLPGLTAMRGAAAGQNNTVELLPPHILLQMVTTAAPTSIHNQPVKLPKEEFVARALRSFDRISTVDSCKAGVLYIGQEQIREADYLMLKGGSSDYDRFLKGLGYEVSLQPPLRFNPQGLSYPRDGETTIAWRDRVTEIVFHVPTMMPPNTDEEPEWTTKKMHVGNCHVNVIFNRSGEVWTFDKLASAFNSINIIITPADIMEGQATELDAMPDFYRVQVVTKDHFPNLSSAADPKIVSAEQLPKLVRLLAINGNVFSEVWRTKENDTEFPSPWRSRLQAIKRLKEQVHAHTERERERQDQPGGQASGATNVGAAGRRTPVPRDEGAAGGGGVESSLGMQLDFGRWTS